MSPMRKRYFLKLAGRILVLIACILLCFIAPAQFDVLEGMNFFHDFSLLHLLWIVWVFGMVHQIFPIRNKLPIGSMKLFAGRFRPAQEPINRQALRNHIIKTTKSAYIVFILWVILTAVLGILYRFRVLSRQLLFLICVFFYVCDLICVLIWCPFRLMMGNRCCTTCRIFNWDHLMMFSPMIFIGGFYALSLAILAILCWLVWELSVIKHPERFWEKTNIALKCASCTDKLCTQCCGRKRK